MQSAAGEPVAQAQEPAGSGLSRVFSTRPASLWSSELAPAGFLSGTAVPERWGSAYPLGEAVSGPAPDTRGLFRDVPADSVEPATPIFFWRRPETPPPVAEHAKAALADALRRAGLDPKDFAVSYWETRGESPWGASIHPQLTIVAPTGHKVDVNPELVVLMPDAAVLDIRRAQTAPPLPNTAV